VSTEIGSVLASLEARSRRRVIAAEALRAPLAGLTVVPAFRDLAQFILNYYQIPPDKL